MSCDIQGDSLAKDSRRLERINSLALIRHWTRLVYARSPIHPLVWLRNALTFSAPKDLLLVYPWSFATYITAPSSETLSIMSFWSEKRGESCSGGSPYSDTSFHKSTFLASLNVYLIL